MESEILIQGWLTKSTSKGLLPTRSRRRWFVLRSCDGLHLEYYKDKHSGRLKESINLADCKLLPSTPNERNNKHSFKLQTPHKLFVLEARNETELNNWLSKLSNLEDLKHLTGAQSNVTDSPSSSDESSPSHSSKASSGPYIRISECFTGNPLHSNTPNVFQFPPNVNWATFPRKGKEPSTNLAPPRPPKPRRSSNGSPFYDDDGDSSSTCSSSLQSPINSAGAEYCNINSPFAPELPPPVHRNLKPDSVPSTSSYMSGTMTLPNKVRGQYDNSKMYGCPSFLAGPVPSIDRAKKPQEGALSLGPTPAQKRHGQSSTYQTALNSHSSLNRFAGPVVTPPGRRPSLYHEYEQASEMQGTYLQIQYPANSKAKSSKGASAAKKQIAVAPRLDPSGSVEYRLIDPVKTQALKKTTMDRDRERDFRANTLGRKQN